MDRMLQDLLNAPANQMSGFFGGALGAMPQAEIARRQFGSQGMTWEQMNGQFGPTAQGFTREQFDAMYGSPMSQRYANMPFSASPFNPERTQVQSPIITKYPPIDWYRVQEIVWTLFGIILAMLNWTP